MNRILPLAVGGALLSVFSACTPMETYEGKMKCENGEIDAWLYVDRSANTDPYGFFCYELSNEQACSQIEKLDIDGEEWDVEVTFSDRSVDLELEKKGKTLEGKFDSGTQKCDLELDLETRK